MRLARPMARLLPVVLAGTVIGCGSSSSPTPTVQPTVVATRTFRDNTDRYSFSYPANWHFGQPKTVQGIYVLPITIPLSKAQIQVGVQRSRVSYANLPEGKKIKTAGGTVTYHHFTMSNRPAIEIDTHSSTGLKQIVSIVNGPKYSYTVSATTPSPALEPRTLYGYRQVVSTLRVL